MITLEKTPLDIWRYRYQSMDERRAHRIEREKQKLQEDLIYRYILGGWKKYRMWDLQYYITPDNKFHDIKTGIVVDL